MITEDPKHRVRTEVKSYRIDYLCHRCKYPVYYVNPFTQIHHCPRCKAVYLLNHNYPHIEYESEDGIIVPPFHKLYEP